MNPEAPATDHGLLPIIARAQLFTAGAILTAGAVFATLGLVDFSTLQSIFGA